MLAFSTKSRNKQTKKKMKKNRAGKRTALEKEGSGGVDGGKKC